MSKSILKRSAFVAILVAILAVCLSDMCAAQNTQPQCNGVLDCRDELRLRFDELYAAAGGSWDAKFNLETFLGGYLRNYDDLYGKVKQMQRLADDAERAYLPGYRQAEAAGRDEMYVQAGVEIDAILAAAAGLIHYEALYRTHLRMAGEKLRLHQFERKYGKDFSRILLENHYQIGLLLNPQQPTGPMFRDVLLALGADLEGSEEFKIAIDYGALDRAAKDGMRQERLLPRLEIDTTSETSPRSIVLSNLRVEVANRAEASLKQLRFVAALNKQLQDPIVKYPFIPALEGPAKSAGIYFRGHDIIDLDPIEQDKIEWLVKHYDRDPELDLELRVPAGSYLVFPEGGQADLGNLPNWIVYPDDAQRYKGYRFKFSPSGRRVDVERIPFDGQRGGFQLGKPAFELFDFHLGSNNRGEGLEGSGSGRFFFQLNRNLGLQTQGEVAFRTSRDRTDPIDLEGVFIDPSRRPLAELSGREAQFDVGPVFRFGAWQAAAMHSLRWIDRDDWDQSGTVGQFFFNVGYLFDAGQVGGFLTRASRREAVVRRVQFAPNLLEETYLSVVDQVGVNFDFDLPKNVSVEGALGYLDRAVGGNTPGGVVRASFPIRNKLLFSAEFGYNESYVASSDSWRFGFGLRFGHWGSGSRSAAGRHDKGPLPVFVPRVRYETLRRVVRSGNQAPVADAGEDRLDLIPERLSDGRLGRLIRLDGSNSSDPDGDAISFRWTLSCDGTAGVELEGAATATPSFVIGNGQACQATLVVTDVFGATDEDAVNISTRRIDQPRIVSFTATPPDVRSGSNSTLAWVVEQADTLTITNVASLPANPIPAGSVSVSPTDTTTYVLTACNSINECASASVTVTVRPDVPVIVRFDANPSDIREGESSTLSWEVQNALTLSVSNVASSELPTPSIPEGSVVVRPPVTTTYVLTVSNGRGEVVTAQTTITVRSAQPRIVFFRANPSEIRSGARSSLEWQVDGPAGTVLTLDNIDTVPDDVPVPNPLPLSASLRVAPLRTTTYTLRATTGSAESVTAQVTVAVQAAVPRIIAFTASPSDSRIGVPVEGASCAGNEAGSLLEWEAENAFRGLAELTNSQGTSSTVPAVGSQPLCLRQTTTFTLTVNNDFGESVSAQVTVTVRPPLPVIEFFRADPTEIRLVSLSETPVTALSWRVLGSNQVTLLTNSSNGSVVPSEVENRSEPVQAPLNGEASATTVFTLTAFNSAGESVSAQVSVVVRPALPVILSFSAEPLNVEISAGDSGGITTLAWQSANAIRVVLAGGSGNAGGIDLPLEGERQETVSETTTFVLTAFNGAGESVSSSIVVTVNRLARPIITSFAADPPTINPGDSTTLTWTTTNAAFVRISFSGGPVTAQLQPNGSITFNPTVTTGYTLRAFDRLGRIGDTRVVVVTVTP